MHCARPRDYHSLGLTRIQFHPPKVTPLTDPAKVSDQGLRYCNSDASDAQQPSKWSHQHNGSAYFPKWKKVPKCTGGTITGTISNTKYRRNNTEKNTLL